MDEPLSGKVFVTGAGGFIGSKVVQQLCENKCDVRTFGRSNSAPRTLHDLPVEHVGGDITNYEQVFSAMEGCSYVYHLAGLVSYNKRDLQRQYGVNVIGTQNVVNASLRHEIKRLVHTSSVAAMGIPTAGTIGTEAIEYNLYGRELTYCDTKYEAELEIHHAFKNGLNTIILNPGIVFGEGDTHPHHHAIFAAMSRGSMIGVPAGGVAFSDINDVVDAHLNASTMGRAGERYALVSANLSYRDAALIFARINNTRPPLFTIPGSVLTWLGTLGESIFPAIGMGAPLTKQNAWLSQHNIFFSSDKAIQELAFKQTSFEDTVRRTAPYYLGQASEKPAGKSSVGIT